MSDQLTDAHYDWAGQFCGVPDLTNPSQGTAPSSTPAQPDDGTDTSAPEITPDSAAPPASAAPAPEITPDSAAPPASAAPAPGDGEIGAALAFQLKKDLPDCEMDYVIGGGSVAYSATYENADSSDADAKVTLQNGHVKYEDALKQKISDSISLSGKAEASDKEGGSVGVELEIGGSEVAKTTISFQFASVDAEKATVKFAVLAWKEDFKLEGTADLGDVKVKYSGTATGEINFRPNWKTLSELALEKLGVPVAEDAALGAAAGGTGSAGAIAVAVAPAAGIIGGIVGGLALTAGVCAGIGKLGDLGADATAVCQDGQRQLRDYAGSYGSTMRGQPGSNQQGTADAEAALQVIMQQNPGISHDQAVQAAIDTKQNYEDVAYRNLLPTMRQRVIDTYKQKEGTLGWVFAGNTLMIVLNDMLDENSHY
jgi:hypothetical protein